MSYFQPVDFHSVEDFLAYLPEEERRITHMLRQIAMEHIPEVREKLSYNVPFYYRKRRICYIWPSAIPWGNVPEGGVQFGFCYGSMLQDESGYLEKNGRKYVYGRTFFSTTEVDSDLLQAYLMEAVEIDFTF